MQLSIRKKDLALLGYWVAAAVAGRLITTSAEIGLERFTLGAVFFILLSAAVRATTQWLALQDEFELRGQWFLATLVGFALNGILIYYLETPILNGIGRLNPQSIGVAILAFAGIQAAQGAFVGFFQWLVLRLEAVYAGWWIGIMALANALSTTAFILLSLTGWQPQNEFIVPVLITLINALISGAGLVQLLSWRWDNEDGLDEDWDEEEVEAMPMKSETTSE
jgi:hypothetical protein